MSSYRFILPVLIGLSIWLPANSAIAQDSYCVGMRPYQNVAQNIGGVIRYLHRTDKVIQDDAKIRVEPRLAGLRGPRVDLIGRDIRLVIENGQISPQEMWHRAQWNSSHPPLQHTRQNTQAKARPLPCADAHKGGGFLGFGNTVKHGLYTHLALETEFGAMVQEPFILYSTRISTKAMIMRPYGLILGAKISTPALTNTHNLINTTNPNLPVRRDMSKFSKTPSFTEAYAAYQATPVDDVHVAVTGGYLEEMYAGIGAEIVWRPFPSLFWVGGDVWSVWRRDENSALNMRLTSRHDITGHFRGGYDFAGGNTSIYGAVGRFLAQDFGVAVGVTHNFDYGFRVDGRMTWSEREDNDGIMNPTNFEPSIRVVWQMPGGNPRHTRGINTHFIQVGRDNGQMLNRPRPLEDFTKVFSAPQIAKHWPDMFLRGTKKVKAPYDGGP